MFCTSVCWQCIVDTDSVGPGQCGSVMRVPQIVDLLVVVVGAEVG